MEVGGHNLKPIAVVDINGAIWYVWGEVPNVKKSRKVRGYRKTDKDNMKQDFSFKRIR